VSGVLLIEHHYITGALLGSVAVASIGGQVACRGEPDTLERQVGATARGAVTWSIRAHILTLTNRNGHVLAYRVSRAPSARSEKWAR
jgi:hypothetical protein